jgi:hypothetical protein
MTLIPRTILTSVPLVALPAIAAETEVETGITSIGPSMFVFTIAAALLLTLIFRASATHLGRYMTARRGSRKIRNQLRKRSQDMLQDILLPGAYGGLARIDHAVLTSGGIVCIRAVHCNGTVIGAEDDPQWTNVDGISRRRFLNPLIQNEGRARAIRKVLPDVPVANVVVFTGKVDFEATPPKNVLSVDQLGSFVDKYVFGPSRVSDWDAVWMSLKAAALTDEASRRDFSAQISFS